MYSNNGGFPPIAGGVAGGSLAYTGVNATMALVVGGLLLVTGLLLVIRSRHFKRTAE